MTGITVVGKRAVIPRGVRIGRNAKVAEGTRAVDFVSRVVKNGASVEAGSARPKRASRAKPEDAASASATNGHQERAVPASGIAARVVASGKKQGG